MQSETDVENANWKFESDVVGHAFAVVAVAVVVAAAAAGGEHERADVDAEVAIGVGFAVDQVASVGNSRKTY